jgi:hypothetical protein
MEAVVLQRHWAVSDDPHGQQLYVKPLAFSVYNALMSPIGAPRQGSWAASLPLPLQDFQMTSGSVATVGLVTRDGSSLGEHEIPRIRVPLLQII